jgi:hypothetical protein
LCSWMNSRSICAKDAMVWKMLLTGQVGFKAWNVLAAAGLRVVHTENRV